MLGGETIPTVTVYESGYGQVIVPERLARQIVWRKGVLGRAADRRFAATRNAEAELERMAHRAFVKGKRFPLRPT